MHPRTSRAARGRRIETSSGKSRKTPPAGEAPPSRDKRSEQERARLAAIVESAEDAIVTKTLDGTITAWNPAAERIYGYAASEAIGQPVAMLIPPERSDEARSIMERVRRGERIGLFETVRLHRSGARIHVALTISPIIDASGRVVAASTIARDLREQKRAASALRESEEWLRLATEAAKVGLWCWDAVADRIEWTPICWELFGIQPGRDVTLQSFVQCCVPDDREHVRAAVARALEEANECAVEARVARPGGGLRWIALRGRAFRHESKRPARMMGVAIDV
jgi:PAS domain S-box-containing protein